MYTSCMCVVEIPIMVWCSVSLLNPLSGRSCSLHEIRKQQMLQVIVILFLNLKWCFYSPFIQTYLLSLQFPQCIFFFNETNHPVLRSERKIESSCVISLWIVFSQYKPLLSVCLSSHLMGFFHRDDRLHWLTPLELYGWVCEMNDTKKWFTSWW